MNNFHVGNACCSDKAFEWIAKFARDLFLVIVQSAIHWLYSFLFPGFGEFEEGLTHLIDYSCRISRNCFDKETIYYDRTKILFTLKYIGNFFFFRISP